MGSDKKIAKKNLAGKSLYLIDGSAMTYRAYFAFIRNPLVNSRGEDTSATFGVVNSLMKILSREKPDYISIISDTKEPTFRHKMYDKYKATRSKMPDEMIVQLPRIAQAYEALNIPNIAMVGYEADDIMATLALEASACDMNVFLVTSDKDMFQIIDNNIRMYIPQKGSSPPLVMDREGVKNKIGIYPEDVVDFMGMTGDSSDNVPGIPGIGPKTALKLMEQFGSLDKLLDGYADIAAKGVRQKVADNRELAILSRKLVRLDCDVPVAESVDDLMSSSPDKDKVRELFTELEFFNLLKEILGESASTDGAPKVEASKAKYQLIDTASELKNVVARLSKSKEIAFDTETDSLDALNANLVGISFSDKTGEACYIPIGHDPEVGQSIPLEEAIKLIQPLLKNKDVQKIAHNFKYDMQVLANIDVTVAPVSFDTFLASYVLNPSARGHRLDDLAEKHFGHTMIPISDLIGSGAKQKSFGSVDTKTATGYAAEDSDYTYRLRSIFAPEIKEAGLEKVFYEIEMPLIAILAGMERNGIKVDTTFLGALSDEMGRGLVKISASIFEIAGYEFNINSTQQLAKILFEELKLPTRRKTAKKTGYSTDMRVLEELSKLHPLPKAIIDYRQLTKLKSTYVDALPRLVDPKTGRVHTSFNQAIAATGRLSSSDPNLQNIPIRTSMGREIRKAFVPGDKNHILLVADYSQVELRILAHFSNDTSMIEAFKNGEDIHSRTAAEVYGINVKDVTSEQRRSAKTANFAVVYGVSAFGLAQQTELNLSQSKDFIDTYFERYPGIKTYMDDTIQSARQDGYVTTLLGRRRYLPDINSKNYQMRQFSERTAINTPIQGTAADLIKIAMIRIDKKMTKMKSMMVLQVHDELVFDARKDEIDKLTALVRKEMSGAIKLKVPLDVDISSGPNWLEAK